MKTAQKIAATPTSGSFGVWREGTDGPSPGSKVSVVIPARNEEGNLPHVLRRLPKWVYEVVLVDGESVDATAEVAREWWPSIRVVHQRGHGKGDAQREGFRHCAGDFIVGIDADGSQDPAEMGRLVARLEAGFDYVKGSRVVAGGGSDDLTRFRSLGNWILTTLTNVLHGSRYTDLTYGYFAFRAGTADAFDLQSDGFEMETEISIKALKAGLRIAEVPCHELKRINGVSQLTPLRDGFRILWVILRERFSIRRTPGRPAPDRVARDMMPEADA
jgi:glycosyltransferase involved in cell wall biosynthesis